MSDITVNYSNHMLQQNTIRRDTSMREMRKTMRQNIFLPTTDCIQSVT